VTPKPRRTPRRQSTQTAASNKSGRHPAAERCVVRLTEPAFADLRTLMGLDPQIVRWALKKMLLLERDPQAGEALHGALIGWRKLVVGNRDWRVVWRVTHDVAGVVVVDVAEVWAVGARSDQAVYKEMTSRVATLPSSPATLALAEVVTRLGRLAQDLGGQPESVPLEDLPDWLVERLLRQVRLPRDQVARMSLQEAVDAWTQWSSRPLNDS
jgi:mRNA interferase RelE/StbE